MGRLSALVRRGEPAVRRRFSQSPLQKRVRDAFLHTGANNLWVQRDDLARRYIRGDGIEIGALTAPQRVIPGVRVTYVDRLDRAATIAVDGPSLRSAGIDPDGLVEVDLVADAERLTGLGDGSQDFVIAHHVVEHLEDPLTALLAMRRVLRPGGVLLLSLPDPRHSFDHRRPRTTTEHVRRDHDEGPAVSRAAHHAEWARLIEGHEGADAEQRAAAFAAADARHHFHVWELRDFLAMIIDLAVPLEIIHAQVHHREFAVVLRRPD